MTGDPLEGTTIGIVGRGRLGTALVAALRDAGVGTVGPLGRGANGDGCDIMLLCVPDAEISRAASAIQPGALVGHTSGATTLDAIGRRDAFSLHPLVSITQAGGSFSGAGCAVAGSSKQALDVATALARALGMNPFTVAESDRALYHAAASMASNYLVTLEGAAERLAAEAGVARVHLVPLVRSAVAHWASAGTAALTGPVVRGDDDTVSRQRAAVGERAPELLPLYDALTTATRDLARSRPR
ncbi:MAG TPA: DUF2520 domain-containing protein [Gemmatimonadaceae bacterium]